jgi:hypothetical protein
LANLKQIEALEPAVKMRFAASFNPELNILLSAELDALAKYWGIGQKRSYPDSEQRLGEFLAHHAGPAWSKCSYLNLMQRASAEVKAAIQGCHPKAAELPNPVRQESELKHILHQDLASIVWTSSVISWIHDPDLEFLLQNAKISAAGIPVKWLRRSRYGEILYRHCRNGWIHALDPDRELQTKYHLILDPEHSLHYVWHNSSRVLAIPTEFILASFELALRAFEAEIAESADIFFQA